MSTAAIAYDETKHPRASDGKFATKPATESDTQLGSPLAPAPMSDEDYRHLVTEFGTFENGYDEDDITSMLEDLEGAEMVCVWDRNEDGDFTGDSEIVGRVGDGPWRRIHPDLWNHLSGEDDSLDGGACTECGGECVVEEDGVSHHLTADGQVDHDADADHVALDESLTENPTGSAPWLDPSTPLLSDEPYELQHLDECTRFGANVAIETDEDDEGGCSCGASLEDGEGYDGLCGDCADRAESGRLTDLAESAREAATDWQSSPGAAAKVRLRPAAAKLIDQGRDVFADTEELESAYDSGDSDKMAAAMLTFRTDDDEPGTTLAGRPGDAGTDQPVDLLGALQDSFDRARKARDS